MAGRGRGQVLAALNIPTDPPSNIGVADRLGDLRPSADQREYLPPRQHPQFHLGLHNPPFYPQQQSKLQQQQQPQLQQQQQPQLQQQQQQQLQQQPQLQQPQLRPSQLRQPHLQQQQYLQQQHLQQPLQPQLQLQSPQLQPPQLLPPQLQSPQQHLQQQHSHQQPDLRQLDRQQQLQQRPQRSELPHQRSSHRVNPPTRRDLGTTVTLSPPTFDPEVTRYDQSSAYQRDDRSSKHSLTLETATTTTTAPSRLRGDGFKLSSVRPPLPTSYCDRPPIVSCSNMDDVPSGIACTPSHGALSTTEAGLSRGLESLTVSESGVHLNRIDRVLDKNAGSLSGGRGRGRGSLLAMLRSFPGDVGSHSHLLPSHPPPPGTKTTGETYSLSSSSSSPSRPKKASATADRLSRQRSVGNAVPLISNYIRVLAKDPEIHQYHCVFQPEVDNYRLRRYLVLNAVAKVMEEEEDVTSGKLSNVAMEFDGNSLFSRQRLPRPEMTLQTETSLNDDGDDSSRVSVSIRHTNDVAWKDCPRIFNVILNNVMNKLKLVRVGKGIFDPNNRTVVGGGYQLDIWPGYVTAIDFKDGGLLVNVQISHRVLRTDTVYDMMTDIYHDIRRGGDENQQQQHGRSKDLILRLQKQIVGETVLTNYNKKTYRVDDVDENTKPIDTFTLADGRTLSYVSYYKQHYNLEIRDMNQPMLVHRPRKSANPLHARPNEEKIIYLVPELCYLTGLTERLRNDSRLMKDVGNRTRLDPQKRVESLRRWIQRVKENLDAYEQLKRWGLDLEDEVLDVEGRILPAPLLVWGDGQTSRPDRKSCWSHEFSRNNFVSAVNLLKHEWLLFYTDDCRPAAETLKRKMMEFGPKMGMRLEEPLMVVLPNQRNDTLVHNLRSRVKLHHKLAVCLFTAKQEDRYRVFKKTCIQGEISVPSQVVLKPTLREGNKVNSVVQKICGQINGKLGGELWRVGINTPGLMVCGYDAFHEAKRGKPSAVGFAASLNDECTRFYSTGTKQTVGQELAENMQLWMTNALRAYVENNGGRLPRKIVFYRDGVSDGQLSTVNNFEVPQIERAIAAFSSEYSPEFVFVVVQKRINSKIFTKQIDSQTGIVTASNPLPGTVVDSSITKTRVGFNFLLVSQFVNQGTVTPTHYVVLKNQSNFTADDIQLLTYKLTYLYYNWTGSVRVPAPCLYAHRLASLIGTCIDQPADDRQNQWLYFL